jgi:hypothetical protein
MCRMKGWETGITPTTDNPVDLAVLKTVDLSTIVKKCHCCRNEPWRQKPPPTDPVGPDYIPITVSTTPGAGLFICTGCPQELTNSGKPKRARGSNKPIPYLKVWCTTCLKTFPGGLGSAFKQRDEDNSWEQIRAKCWHCTSSEGSACHPSCPKTQRQAAERKRKLETLPPNPPNTSIPTPPPKRQRTTALAPALPHAQVVVERDRNVQDLAAKVLSQDLFSPHPDAFVYFIPHFKLLKNGAFALETPKVTNPPKYPRWVSMSRSHQTNGTGPLHCPTCTGACIHVQVLQRVLELRNERPCKAPITPEAQFSHSKPLKLANGLQGFWAVLQGKEKWVLCGQKGESWVCQEDPRESKCRHACTVLEIDYVHPDIVKERYKGPTKVLWQAIPLETPCPPKPDSLTTMVCEECRHLYEHTRTITENEFEGCSHKGTKIHVCTPYCQQILCCKPPPEQVSDNEEDDEKEDLVATWRRKRLLRRSAEGYFSQPPPVGKVAPCGYNWRRRTLTGATIYNDTDTVDVDLCVWHCTRRPINECCTLQPLPKEFFFLAPTKMRISHMVLSDEVDHLVYEGGTFQEIKKRADRRAHRRKGEQFELTYQVLPLPSRSYCS